MSLVPNVIFSYCLKRRCYARSFLICECFSILDRRKTKKKKKKPGYPTNYFLTHIKNRCHLHRSCGYREDCSHLSWPFDSLGTHSRTALSRASQVRRGCGLILANELWLEALLLGESFTMWHLLATSPSLSRNTRGTCTRRCRGQPRSLSDLNRQSPSSYWSAVMSEK